MTLIMLHCLSVDFRENKKIRHASFIPPFVVMRHSFGYSLITKTAIFIATNMLKNIMAKQKCVLVLRIYFKILRIIDLD